MFKNSRGMVETTGLATLGVSALTAKHLLGASQAMGGLIGWMLRPILVAFDRRAGVAYSTFAYLFLAFALYMFTIDPVYPLKRFDDMQAAQMLTLLFAVNAFHVIARNAFQLEKEVPEMVRGYSPAYFGASVLFFSIMIGLDLFAPQVLSGMTPESVLVVGFMAFSIYPKVCYYIVREIRGKEQMLAIANNQVNAGWSESNPQHVAQLETTWKNFKKAIKLKSLWRPSWIYFITVPAMFLVITR